MGKHLGRKLGFNEIVHHKDEDRANNEIENLKLMSRSEHSKHHKAQPEFLVFDCPGCGCEFDRLARYHRKNQKKKNGAGPFCGRSCAGRFNQTKKAA